MKQLLKQLFEKYQIDYDEKSLELFDTYYQFVVEENKKFNLTAITEKEDFAVKHFLDCAIAAKLFPLNAKVIDVGAGAGFPSIVLKIIRPDLEIVMLDSLNKRVNFLNDCINLLKLTGISAVHARAEDYAKKTRESFDVATARAVAPLNTLCEYCLPFVKKCGKFIALKGANYQEELMVATNAIKILKGKLLQVFEVFIEESNSKRANIVIEKVDVTLVKYPRGKNLPKLKPL